MYVKRLILFALASFTLATLSGCGGNSSTSSTTTGSSLPVSVSVTASATNVDATNAVTLTAAVTNDKNAAGVTWTVSGGGTLSGSTTTSVIYTAPAPSVSALNAIVTATSVTDTTKSATAKIAVPAGPAITTASLAAGAVGGAYSATLAGGGGIGPYTWSVAAGTLPAGLTLSSSGVLSGTPAAAGAGTANVTFQMTDSGKAIPLSATATLPVTIAAAPAVAFGAAPTLTAGTCNVSYVANLDATGGLGTLTYNITAGALPAGLTISAAGLISGTPTAAGTFAFSVKAADSFGDSATQAFSLKIAYPALSITPATLPTGSLGTNYPATTLAATGGSGTGYTWTLAPGSTLPAGLTLSAAGVLSGRPTASSNLSFTAMVTDSASDTASAVFALTITGTLSISTPLLLPNGYIGASYSKTLTAAGGSGTGYTWQLGNGSLLPSGLTLSPSGVIAGKPTDAGTSHFTVTVTDSATSRFSATFSLTISIGVTITTLPTLPGAIDDGAYYTTFSAVGGSGTNYSWAVSAGSTLPAGLRLYSNGALSGEPKATGTFPFSVTVTDSASNTASASFSLTVGAGVSITTPRTLPAATAGSNYSQTLAATGGTGTGYTWSVTAGSASLAAVSLSLSTSGVLSGKPGATGTATFTASVQDSFADTTSATLTVTVNPSGTLALPIPTPASLPAAIVNQGYSGSVSASGGVAPFTWTVNGSSVPSNGTPTALSNGLTVTSSGGASLAVAGTPLTTGTISFTLQVTDSQSSTAGPMTYTIAVEPAQFAVSGNVSLINNCANASVPAITLSINTTPVQTATTDGNGNYSFANVANGTYTITPSIAGPSSVFFPATLPGIVVNTGAVTGQNFAVSLGYTVSGTVTYTGAQTGQTYVSLTSACGGSPLGTSVAGAAPFTIQGVPPGTYTLSAGMDILGFGSANAADPSGTAAVSVSNANVTGASVTMTDPQLASLTAGPAIHAISPTDQGVVISFGAITTSVNGTQVELPTSYTVEWSADSTFTSGVSSLSFKAGGANGTGVWFLNNATAGINGTFANGTSYYFRAQGVAAGGPSAWTVYGGSTTPVAVTIGAPVAANTVSGTITFSTAPTGPLMVGFFDPSSGQAYATRIPNPTSPQGYSVQVPSGSSYFFFAILDQNNDGMIDAGDNSNTRNNSANSVSISADATENLNLPSVNSNAVVTTQNWTQTNQSGTSSGFNLGFDVMEAGKLPVSVTLISGPSVIHPIDIGKCGTCGNNQFQYFVPINNNTPSPGDSYQFQVTYSDTTSEVVTATVTAVLNAFATNLQPSGASGAGTSPMFSWTDPANAGSYLYQFSISDNTGQPLWQVPGNNSKTRGFSSAITSLVWGTDPSDSNNTPAVNLTSGDTYVWQIQVQDASGNSAQAQTYFIP